MMYMKNEYVFYQIRGTESAKTFKLLNEKFFNILMVFTTRCNQHHIVIMVFEYINVQQIVNRNITIIHKCLLLVENMYTFDRYLLHI